MPEQTVEKQKLSLSCAEQRQETHIGSDDGKTEYILASLVLVLVQRYGKKNYKYAVTLWLLILVNYWRPEAIFLHVVVDLPLMSTKEK